ncbi:hypothetical protein NMY22_g7229 [Coprinellus aureogranulatus]|nr:hypothetical protein NMY22_g7229 [Coprinellus aureogranulatus]
MDVLLEILLLLDAKDLVTMSRSNKDFRKALVNATMNRILWKSCAAPNVVTDFYLLKRLCTACKKANYLSEVEVDVEELWVLTLVPMTCYGPWSSKYPATNNQRFCWYDDYDSVIYMLNGLGELVENEDPVGRLALNLYKEKQLNLVLWIEKMAPVCYAWFEKLQKQRQLDRNCINERRAQAIRLRFCQLGYEEIDVDQVVRSNTPEVCGKAPNITNRVWKNIREKLEPQVIETKVVRLSS